MADPFTDLCVLASEQHWCWIIHCGTCGHGVFRWAFQALSKGKRPGRPDWNIRWGPDGNFTELEALNGPMPPFEGWLPPEQRALQKIMAEADLACIASACKFPDWLGHLGLGLHYTQDAGAEQPRLTRALVPQLFNLVDPQSMAAKLLTDLGSPRARGLLTWSDFPAVEAGIAGYDDF